MSVLGWFPNLARGGFSPTSPATAKYNCIAWAAGDQDKWWWPDPLLKGYWPAGAPRQETLGAFIAAYATLGYTPCAGQLPDTLRLEFGFEKIAIYAIGSRPTHASRQ